MFEVIKGKEGTVFTIKAPKPEFKVIVLETATQEQLGYLFSLSHPFVKKVDKK